MFKKNWQIVAIVVVLGALSLGASKCSKEQQQDFRSGVKIGAMASVEVREQVKDLCRAELMKPESCAKAIPQTEKIADIATRLDQFADAHPKLNAESKQEALALVDDLLKGLDALEADGVIDFKDPDSRRKFLLGLAFAKSGVRIARNVIANQPVPSPSPEASPAPSE